MNGGGQEKATDNTLKTLPEGKLSKIQIRKNQIDTHWQYAKAEAEIHCKKFLQIYIGLLALGSSIWIGAITLKAEPLFSYILFGTIPMLVGVNYIYKVHEILKLLKLQMIRFQYQLEDLK